MTQHTLAIIPARAGSKRFPGKNMALLKGKPLLAYSIEACMAAQRVTRIVVSSDDEEMLALANRICPGSGLKRPDQLASDKAMVFDTLVDVVGKLEAAGEGPFDIIMVVQCTSPLTTGADIDGAVVAMLSDESADSAATIMALDHAIHPMKLKKFEEGWLLPLYAKDQAMQAEHQMEKAYVRNGSAYVCRRSTFEAGKLIGERCKGYLMPPERSIDINVPVDLQYAEFLMDHQSSFRRSASE